MLDLNCSQHSNTDVEQVVYDWDKFGWFSYDGEWRLLQPLWKLAIAVLGKKCIESPMSVALIPLAFHFSSVTLFTICDIYGQNWKWIQKYKIQSKVCISNSFNSLL